MKQVQDALATLGIPVSRGIWQQETDEEYTPPFYVVYSTTMTEDYHADDVPTSMRTYVYMELWATRDPSEYIVEIRRRMYAAGFFMVEESDKGYNQPSYDTASNRFNMSWTWCYREDV